MFHISLDSNLNYHIFQLMFTVIARLLLQFNSSVNPIVYATTVPEFRTIIQRLLPCGRNKQDEKLSQTKTVDYSNSNLNSQTLQFENRFI